MPPITRSSELLNVIDGLFFIDQDVIDLASNLYNELKSVMATFGEGAIKLLVPHISSLMSKLNDLSKENSDLKQEVKSITSNLVSVEHRCMDLNNSYKDKSMACCELEEQYDSDINTLNAQLVKCKEDNARLQETVNRQLNVDNDMLLVETREKIASLTEERQCLLTSIEVLEADVRALRVELRQAESRARQRWASADDSLLAEMTLAGTRSRPPSTPTTADQSTTTPDRDGSDQPTIPSSPPVPHAFTPTLSADPQDSSFKNVLLIGDSHLRYASSKCLLKGAYIECCPGGKIVDIKNRLLSYVGLSLSVIYIHVGANNLRKGYRGGPGYNGGHGKREALHSMADLLFTVKSNFQNSKIFLDSVLIRRDFGYKPLYDFNLQLELMCNNFDVEFVEANTCVSRRDLAQDGVHFSRRGVARLGSLFVNAISAALRYLDAAPAYDQGEDFPSFSLSSGPGNIVRSDPDPSGSCDVSRVPGN